MDIGNNFTTLQSLQTHSSLIDIKNVDGKLYRSNYLGDTFIGYSEEAYKELEKTANEALDKAEEYYQMLLQNGLIEKPKTQDDINKELINSINSIADTVKSLQASIKELQYEYPRNSKQDEITSEDVKYSETSISNSTKVPSNKRRTKASSE